ncbi:hypothetical protein ACMAUO_01285 [Gluconacetobacter sp. Hr-1-5]|uniref:hypothetical protein n=1 Tax=Gluconacetobacter sp. Hr-1-5 TaxID=3395370 RepID=UPI003B52D1FC
MRRAAHVAAMIAAVANVCLLVGCVVFQIPFCLDTLDRFGRYMWISLLPGAVIPIWRRWNVPYAERVRLGW